MERLAADWHRGNPDARPRPVSDDDGAAIARLLHEEMDRGTAARADQARENDLVIACEAGCSHCCENIIFVFQAEAIAVAKWLLRSENQAPREHFMAAYPGWRAAVGDAPERAVSAQSRGDRAGFEQAVKDVWSGRVMCAFNRDGVCTVYPVRPNYCRNCHALDHNEYCVSGSQSAPKALEFVPIDDFMRSIRPLTESLHISLGQRKHVSIPLCDAVFHELERALAEVGKQSQPVANIGRNSPCPCDSGKKYKLCCGR